MRRKVMAWLGVGLALATVAVLGWVVVTVPDRVIPLTLTKGGVTLTAQNPLGLAMSPAGEQMYVLVRAFSPADLGDGIMVINTRSEHATDFIPLSGGGFPRVPSPIAPGAVSVRKFAPRVVSPDGDLLYVWSVSAVGMITMRYIGPLFDDRGDLSITPAALIGARLVERNYAARIGRRSVN